MTADECSGQYAVVGKHKKTYRLEYVDKNGHQQKNKSAINKQAM